MGYRELLKKYIRHLEIYSGDNYIEVPNKEPWLSQRDLGELRTLAAEIAREQWNGKEADRAANFNHRLRVLMNRYALTTTDVAVLMGFEPETVRRWRLGPRSDRYLAMTEQQFSDFQKALNRWLEMEGN